MDLVVCVVGLTGLADGWICWQEGVKGNAVFRAVVGLGFASWGWLEMSGS